MNMKKLSSELDRTVGAQLYFHWVLPPPERENCIVSSLPQAVHGWSSGAAARDVQMRGKISANRSSNLRQKLMHT